MARLRASIERVAVSNAPVLVVGETGSGKELVARALHALSNRRERPFVALNCGALSENLLAAELFGSVRGAFTGASTHRSGLFVAAHGGTLFLDEVGDMPAPMQTAMLRALETGEIRAVGATEARKVDVRVIAASHRNLLELVRGGKFRDDLRYRLDVVRIDVPPLRSRLEDLPELCERLLLDVRRQYDLPERRASARALEALRKRRFPGNVRELRHLLASAALASSSALIEPEDLPPERDAPEAPTEDAGAEAEDSNGDGHAVRAEAIRRALVATKGHRARAAKLLGISRATLYRYCEAHQIELSELDGSRDDIGSG
jgi:transcriptional regulator with PAS, ATPase and Fis domain